MNKLLITALLACVSCQHNANNNGTTPNGVGGAGSVVEVPEQVDAGNHSSMVRRLRASNDSATGRDDLRELVIVHQQSLFDAALREGAPERAWALFADSVLLYRPSELEPGGLAPAIAEMAEQMLLVYEPRGDEARVLGALAVLTLASPEPDQYTARYAEVVRWSEEVRQTLPSDTERVLGLVEIFEGVTRIVALPDAVRRLSDLYIERHHLLQGAFGGMLGLQALLSPRGRGELQNLLSARGQTVADIVTLYLRAGEPDEVRGVVSPLGALVGRDRELVAATRDLRSDRRRARGMTYLASNLGRENPDVAIRICHEGHRSFPQDALFTQCLAEIYRHLRDHDGALDYYEATLANEPTAENYERTLEFAAARMEEQLDQEDTAGARATHDRAERILESFAERFPNREAPIQTHHFAFLIGMGEYNAGNIDQAVERFEASLAISPTRPALLQLGMIHERRGQAEQAITFYRQALDLREEGNRGENPLNRSTVLNHLGDAYDLAGNRDRAVTLFTESLEMLRIAEASLPPGSAAEIHLARGFTFYKLRRGDEGAEELRQALAAAPQRRATYGRLLSFYVGRGMVEEALDVFRHAFNHSELDQTWKIYYSMWVVGLQRRLNHEPDQVAVRFLEGVEGDEWIQRLGRYYAGTLPYAELIAAAETQGQRAEAYFYEAVVQLAAGNRTQGTQLLTQVIETDMLGYFEYEFARQLQRELARTAPATSAATR